ALPERADPALRSGRRRPHAPPQWQELCDGHLGALAAQHSVDAGPVRRRPRRRDQVTDRGGRFFAYYRPYRRLLLIDFGAAVLLGLLELAFPTAVQAFIDRLLPTADWPLILVAAVGLLLVYMFNTVLMGIVNYF